MTRVLVTGGAGFIGSHIVDHLVASGYAVSVLDNLADQVHDGEPDYRNAEADYTWGDVRDRELVAELLADADVLCHQASAVGIGQSMYEIERYVDVNSLGTARLLDVVVNEEVDLKKIVTASSMSIYGEGLYYCPSCAIERQPATRSEAQLSRGGWEPTCGECGTALEPRPTPETARPDSTSVYAITKRDQEELTLAVARAYDIPAVALRYFNTYGSRQALGNPYTGVCAIFSSRINNDRPPVVYEDGRQTRDFVHVSDVARANRLAIERDVSDTVLNVGTGLATSVREIADTLLGLYGKADEIEPEISGEFRAGDIRHCIADTERAETQLGYEPTVGFEAGMAELVEWAAGQEATDQFDAARAELETRDLVDGG